MCNMRKVGVRELRLDTAQVLQDVSAGESVDITLRGRTVARLRPVRGDRTWMPRAHFVGVILGLRPDRRLAADARAVAPDSTSDEP
jgi:antitoxin (DNA-binding transcriptional repressor) of toxin-antitoxin stability system